MHPTLQAEIERYRETATYLDIYAASFRAATGTLVEKCQVARIEADRVCPAGPGTERGR